MSVLPSDLASALEEAEAAGRLGAVAGRLTYEDVVTSTNDLAATLAERGAPDGTTVLAGAQTGGRGRHGRVWYSPPASGLYLSTVMRVGRPEGVTLMAGVALAEGVREATGLGAELKWPNDVILPRPGGPRPVKVAGILAETAHTGSESVIVVLGIGINVRTAAVPAALVGRASSLEAELGAPVDRSRVLVETLVAIARWREILADSGLETIRGRWRTLSPTSAGASVAWGDGDRRRRGVTAGLDGDGALLVACGGRTERVVGGTLTWLTAGDQG
jgi:BirA family biotin operon repressor/biotin-[acetyl-CoA-carboxylase] ligase